MPFEKEKADILGMVQAGNYGWAILALMDLVDVQELHCQEMTERSIKSGRLQSVIQGIGKKEPQGEPCPRCNSSGVFNYGDERCELCHGEAFLGKEPS